jgi:IrrE N-terminal-like domain
VDVIRVAELSTAYSFTVGGRPVIAVPATASWFRENWDLAHELGHLAERHDAEGISGPEADRREAAANAFAADLLLPAETRTANSARAPSGIRCANSRALVRPLRGPVADCHGAVIQRGFIAKPY